MPFECLPELYAVADIVRFLDFGTDVARLISRGYGGLGNNLGKLSETYDRLKSNMEWLQGEISHRNASSNTGKALHRLKIRCLNLARTLADPMGETITALATEEIENPDPEQGWKLVFSRAHEPTGDEETFVDLSADFLSWLALALKSDDWEPMVQLRKIREDAEALRSYRAYDIDRMLRDALVEVSQQLPKTGGRRRPSRARDHPHPGSSDDSGHESDRDQRPKKPRRKRPGQGHESAAGPSIASRSTARDAGRQGEAPAPAFIWATALCAIANRLNELDRLILTVPKEFRILRALSFETIDSREDSIQDADAATFRWLLEEPVEQDLEPHMATARRSLLQWLSEGQGIYHVSGKPGSGKSTLFKLIASHPRTKSELEKWADWRDLVITSFYFWNSGNAEQTSWEGFQRSVLMQFLRRCPGETCKFFPDTWNTIGNLPDDGATIPDSAIVSEKNLWVAWKLLCTKKETDYRICMFIDGLDEFTETEKVKFSTLSKGLRFICQHNPTFKLCVSSRPLPQIQSVFDPDQRVHLHELTSRDIRTAASSAVLAIAEQEKLTREGERLVATIVDKSQGVFIWVKTVLQSIQAMLTSTGPLSDSAIAKVNKNISAYPSDIDDLYHHLLRQVGPSQRSMSALMFGLVIDNPFAQPPNAMWFYWAEQLIADPDFPGKSDSAPCTDPYTAQEVRVAHTFVRDTLVKLTKGLLTMHKDRRERKDGDQFYRERVQFSHRTARDFFRSPRGQSRLHALEPSISQLPGQASSSSGPSTSGPPVVPQSSLLGASNRGLSVSSVTAQKHVSVESFARLRLAEIVLAGKYRVASGADPRRRRLYSNYLRSLLLLKTNSELSYQVPFKFMEILRRDLETTHAGKFGSAYVVSSFRSITKLTVTEDPEKPASFLHLALAYGQYSYLLKDLQRTQTPVPDSAAGGEGEKNKASGQPRKMKTTPAEELSLLLTAVFGKTDSWKRKSKLDTLLPFHDAMASVPIRSPVSNDFLSEVSRKASIPLIFSSTIVFLIHHTFGGFYRTRQSNAHNFELLARLVVYNLEMPNADTTPLNFVFLLQTQQDYRAPAPEPRKPADKESLVRGKSIPKELHAWITSPMKNASGEPIFPNSAEPPETGAEASAAHPCGVVIKETHHTTLKAVFSQFVDDRALLERFCKLVPDDVSGTVLNEQSEVFANFVSDSSLNQYVCKRAVASDGLVVDADSDLCFRVY